MRSVVFAGIAALLLIKEATSVRPLIVWHGINDDCNGFAGDLIRKIKSSPGLENLYVHCIRVSDDDSKDKRGSIFTDARKQLAIACEKVANDENLRNGFNAFGISQGGLLLRALIQTCPPSRVNNFVSFSAPHQGVFGIPNCYNVLPAWGCRFLTKVLGKMPYATFVQKMLVPAQYWHDPLHEAAYRQKSTFLGAQNNENDAIRNQTFKDNFLKVNKLVLVRNLDDEILVPRETAHFAFFREGQQKDVVNFTDTRLYNEDLIGLRQLIEAGKVEFQEIPGKHMQYNVYWLRQIAMNYFSD